MNFYNPKNPNKMSVTLSNYHNNENTFSFMYSKASHEKSEYESIINSYLDSELLHRSHRHSPWPHCKVCWNEYIFLSRRTVYDWGDIWSPPPVHLRNRNNKVLKKSGKYPFIPALIHSCLLQSQSALMFVCFVFFRIWSSTHSEVWRPYVKYICIFHCHYLLEFLQVDIFFPVFFE